ncbi:MAG: hypothetical protein U0936_12380 [Planctomycetaceae bacterium]
MEPTTFNPYAAPEEQALSGSSLPSDPTALRKQFIHCESNIKSIAGLMILGGLLVSLGFGVAASLALAAVHDLAPLMSLFLVAVILAGFWQIYTGVQLRRLKHSARTPAAIACGLWILFFPVGTILGGVSLWYLLCPAATFVFSEEYAEVIRNTPDIELFTSIAGWSLLMVVLSAIGLALLAATFLG